MKINCSWAPLLVLRGFSGRRREPGTRQAWLESRAHGGAGLSSPARRWVRQCAFSQSIGTFNTGLWLFKIHKCRFLLWRNSWETRGGPTTKSRGGTQVSEMLLVQKWMRQGAGLPRTTWPPLNRCLTNTACAPHRAAPFSCCQALGAWAPGCGAWGRTGCQ